MGRLREKDPRTLIVVDDGSSLDVARELDVLAEETGVELLRLPERFGKGSAVSAGVDAAGGADAVLVIDADGQHPPAAIPALLRAARRAELVIGDRFGDLLGMPWQRRLTNRASRRLFTLVAGREVRDTQNGMPTSHGTRACCDLRGDRR